MKYHLPTGYVFALVDLLVALMVAAMAWAIIHVQAAKHKAAPVAVGDLVVTMHWDNAVAADVDLWVRAPGVPAVGYSNRDGKYCDLARDDLGHGHDPIGLNFEQVTCRGAPAGDYIINAVLYSSWDKQLPVRVTIWVTNKAGDELQRRTVLLRFVGAEDTVTRFQLDKNGAVVPGSINDLETCLYEQGCRR